MRHVSAQLDIDTAILSKIERGERKATRDQITKLADILELDKESLLIQYLSEKILYEIQDEDLGIQALKVAEKTIKYGVSKKEWSRYRNEVELPSNFNIRRNSAKKCHLDVKLCYCSSTNLKRREVLLLFESFDATPDSYQCCYLFQNQLIKQVNSD